MKLAASFALIVALFATSASARDVVIHAGSLLDGVTDSPRREVSILVQDDRITAVEPGFVKPAGSEIIDLSGQTLDAQAWASAVREHGVLIQASGARQLRLVTHRHIDSAAIARTLAAFTAVAGK